MRIERPCISKNRVVLKYHQYINDTDLDNCMLGYVGLIQFHFLATKLSTVAVKCYTAPTKFL